MHVCMYACMHVCMYACMHVCMYACMHVCMYACMHVCMYACMHVCMYACMHVCMYACMHVCMYACMHACMHACMYVCMYVYIYYKAIIFQKRHRFVSFSKFYASANHSDFQTSAVQLSAFKSAAVRPRKSFSAMAYPATAHPFRWWPQSPSPKTALLTSH